ncbi:MAG: MBL fold metallo-hydrolase [Bacteroidetes bacterium]|nr:MBL fold metallo-hydrolase [Bacteroidota bacterium]
MKLYSVNTGFFKLDGGAMFSVVPKSIWNRTNPADQNNMISLAMRALLIEDGNRLILIDNGIGNKQDDNFLRFYFLHGDDSLDKSLKKYGFERSDITDVIISHLHFDHCGGSVKWKDDRSGFEPTFKNAAYWSNKKQWDWALSPNRREKASFLSENIVPVQESGQLKFVEENQEIIPGISLMFSFGHTEGMMHPVIRYNDKTVVYVSDMIPTSGHLPVPYVMSYDVRPLVTMAEKEKFLKHAAENDFILFFEHDPVTECCTLQITEKGVRLRERFLTSEI